MKTASLALVAALLVEILPAADMWAATAAYWRHEEGPAGSLIPDGPNTVLDSSGNGNHMQTFSSAFTPFTSATYSSTVSPLHLRSGLANTLSLDFGTGSDGTTPEGGEPNDDNFTTGEKPINAQIFTAMTIELAFRMKSVGPGQYEALFGKDGKPLGDGPGEPDSPVPPLKIMVRGDDFPNTIPNQLFVEWIDGDGDIHNVASGETVVTGTWYHVAFTLSATDAELWVAHETGRYQLKGAISGDDFAGNQGRVIIEEPLGYSIGRGMFNNGVTDWANAFIDEVRVSDTVLTANQFEFLPAVSNNADFDGDGDVDGADFLTWQRNSGTTGTGTRLLGDANGDTNINAADLSILRTQFGTPGGASAIPEPASMTLAAAFATVGAGLIRKRRAAN